MKKPLGPPAGGGALLEKKNPVFGPVPAKNGAGGGDGPKPKRAAGGFG